MLIKVLLHPRRGAAYQELQEPAVAAAAQLQQQGAPPAHRHAAAEQPHGAVVPHALPHARCLPGNECPTFRSLRPFGGHDVLCHQNGPIHVIS